MDTLTMFYTIDALLGSVVYAYGVSRMLPMRAPLVFGFVFVGTVTLLNGFCFGFMDAWIAIVLVFAAQCVLPFFLFRGSAPVRAVTVLAAFVCESCSSLVFYAVLAIATGQVVPEDAGLYVQFILSYLPAYAISCLVSWLVLLSLLRLVSGIARRFAKVDENRSSWVFVAFALSHILLMMLLAIVVAMVDTDAWFYMVSIGLCALCLIVDVLIYSFMDRAISAAKDSEKALLLNRSLDACLKQCDTFVAEVERTAKVRHDARNQAQAAITLAERGDFAHARVHLSTFRASI